jgi:hypothetical protein
MLCHATLACYARPYYAILRCVVRCGITLSYDTVCYEATLRHTTRYARLRHKMLSRSPVLLCALCGARRCSNVARASMWAIGAIVPGWTRLPWRAPSPPRRHQPQAPVPRHSRRSRGSRRSRRSRRGRRVTSAVKGRHSYPAAAHIPPTIARALWPRRQA